MDKVSMLIDGKEYYDLKMVSEVWKMKPDDISKLCRQGKIDGAVKKKKGFIPSDTRRPISEIEMKRLLASFVILKNNPNYPKDELKKIKKADGYKCVLDYLYQRQMIESFEQNNVNIKDIKLTILGLKTGIDFLYKQSKDIEWGNVVRDLLTFIGTCASIASLLL